MTCVYSHKHGGDRANDSVIGNIFPLTRQAQAGISHPLSNPDIMEMRMIDQARLLEVLHYEPQSGAWTWKVDAGPRTLAGSRAGHKGPKGRPVVLIDGSLYYLARLAILYITGDWPIGQITYASEDETDLRLENLLDKSRSEIRASSKLSSLNTSGIKGVSWKKTKAKWVAMITRHGVQYYLGEFGTKEEAARAYHAAAAGGTLPERGSTKDPGWNTSRRQRSAPWKAIQENPSIVGWDSLEQFIADVGEPPTPDHVLMRARYDDPLGPGNAKWRLPWAKRAGHEEEPAKSYNLMQFEISVAEYNRLSAEQQNLCAICHRQERRTFRGKPSRLAVDHRHSDGVVRGLLCQTCNMAVGLFEDDPDLLRAAADYLERHESDDDKAKRRYAALLKIDTSSVIPLKKDIA